ncbi:succinate dehydrogenase assembly factor 2 [Roseicitreum antarcticum]|nr:succinate dehydrogenase assembly factor 2 [Roseicitreum antarcticum]
MRSWRRGMKEMDLILGPFSDTGLAALDPVALDLYERMLGENDQDLYLWVTGAKSAPDQFTALLTHIGGHVGIAPRPSAG